MEEKTDLQKYEDWWNISKGYYKTLAKGVLEPWDEHDESDNIPFKIVTSKHGTRRVSNEDGSYRWEHDGVHMEAIFIMFEGHGDADSPEGLGQPIMIEIHEGEVTIRVWSDINNNSDATHRWQLRRKRQRRGFHHQVNLEHARESEREN